MFTFILTTLDLYNYFMYRSEGLVMDVTEGDIEGKCLRVIDGTQRETMA